MSGRPNRWRLVVHPPGPAPWLMAVDEALSGSVRSGDSPPVLRFFQWDRPSVSLGCFQDVETATNPAVCRRHGIPVVRRITGGRAIVHGDELTYSFSAPIPSPAFTRDLHETYGQLSEAITAGLRHLGIPAAFRAVRAGAPGNRERRIRSPLCFETISYAEVTVGGKKIVGSAQKRWANGFLQQGSIPLARDPEDLTWDVLRFATPAAREASRGRAGEKTVSIREIAPGVSPLALMGALRAGFEETFHVVFTADALTPPERHAAARLVRTRYGHDPWTYRKMRRGDTQPSVARPALAAPPATGS